MGRRRIRTRDAIILTIIIGIICFLAGYTIGISVAIGWCVEVGYKIMEKTGINLDINLDFLKKVVFQYKNNILNLT